MAIDVKDTIERALAYIAKDPPLTDQQLQHALARVCRNDSGAMFALAAEARALRAEVARMKADAAVPSPAFPCGWSRALLVPDAAAPHLEFNGWTVDADEAIALGEELARGGRELARIVAERGK